MSRLSQVTWRRTCSFPRMCGGDPKLTAIAVASQEFSPVSGDEPGAISAEEYRVGFPRVGGDEPVAHRSCTASVPFSPRERG